MADRRRRAFLRKANRLKDRYNWDRILRMDPKGMPEGHWQKYVDWVNGWTPKLFPRGPKGRKNG